MAININEVEFEDLKTLCKKLLNFCNKLSKKPNYITNTIRIVLEHSDIINKLNLFDNKREVDEYMLPVRRKCTKPRRERPEKQMYYNAVVKMTMEWLQTHETVTASNINKEYKKVGRHTVALKLKEMHSNGLLELKKDCIKIYTIAHKS